MVADEVRNLAAKSAEAAKSTTEMIQASIRSVESGVKIAAEAADSLVVVREKAAFAISTVDEICRASRTQMEEIEIVSTGVQQISNVIQTNTANAEEGAAVSQGLASQTKLLKDQAGRFHLHQTLTPKESSEELL